jgi:hypothetical protein
MASGASSPALSSAQCQIAWMVLFLKSYSHNNYIPVSISDDVLEEFTSDLQRRINKMSDNRDLTMENLDEFIQYLYFGIIRRRFPKYFNNSVHSKDHHFQPTDDWNHEIFPESQRPKW